MVTERVRLRAAVARASRPNSSTADQRDALLTEYRTVSAKEYIDQLLATAPPLSSEQCERLAAQFLAAAKEAAAREAAARGAA